MPKSYLLYTELAPYWQAISPTSDYQKEAEVYCDILLGYNCKTVLELGAGGGNNAFYMKKHFTMTLSDISPDMLKQSELQNPECHHIVASMFNLKLAEKFDAVFLHDASSYITSLSELRQAVNTCVYHCNKAGIVLLALDDTRETFKAGTNREVHDFGNAEVRYSEIVGPLHGDGITFDYTFVIDIEESGTTRRVVDKQTAGVFSVDQWRHCFRELNFNLRPVELDSSKEDSETGVLLLAIPV